MEGWTIGVVVVLVLGLAAILYGALSDRAKTNRARREILSPPDRTIPRFSPDTVPPRYLSELQARRPPSDATATALEETRRAEVRRLLSVPSTTKVPAGLASRVFVTDPPTGWAVLDGPAVVVCADPVTSFRELLPVVERELLSRAPLVLAVPEISGEALATLEVNHIQQLLHVAVVTSKDADLLRRIADTVGARPVDHSDLQAGYVTDAHLGWCSTWVSDRGHSWIIAAGDDTAPGGQGGNA